MDDEAKKGYFYGLKFNREYIKGIRELFYYTNNNKDNITCYFPDNDKCFYILYDENLIKGNSSIENFIKCNHWIIIRQRLDIIFDNIIKEYICEFNEHPRKIYYF